MTLPPAARWGAGENGQIGHGVAEQAKFPRVVDAMYACVAGATACGEYHSCCLASGRFRVAADAEAWRRDEGQEYALKGLLVQRGAGHHGQGSRPRRRRHPRTPLHTFRSRIATRKGDAQGGA